MSSPLTERLFFSQMARNGKRPGRPEPAAPCLCDAVPENRDQMPSVSLAAITTTLLQVTPGDSLRSTNEPTSVERMSVAVLWLFLRHYMPNKDHTLPKVREGEESGGSATAA